MLPDISRRKTLKSAQSVVFFDNDKIREFTKIKYDDGFTNSLAVPIVQGINAWREEYRRVANKYRILIMFYNAVLKGTFDDPTRVLSDVYSRDDIKEYIQLRERESWQILKSMKKQRNFVSMVKDKVKVNKLTRDWARIFELWIGRLNERLEHLETRVLPEFAIGTPAWILYDILKRNGTTPYEYTRSVSDDSKLSDKHGANFEQLYEDVEYIITDPSRANEVEAMTAKIISDVEILMKREERRKEEIAERIEKEREERVARMNSDILSVCGALEKRFRNSKRARSRCYKDVPVIYVIVASRINRSKEHTQIGYAASGKSVHVSKDFDHAILFTKKEQAEATLKMYTESGDIVAHIAYLDNADRMHMAS